MNYSEFLASKAVIDPDTGFEPSEPINPMLYDFQADLVRWALRRGRAALFCDCGLGKTPMQLEWAKHVPGNVLILAPLAVAHQTIREGKKFGIECEYARKQSDANGAKITVTNYEMLEHFDRSKFNAIVLDESSILKSYDGKTRTRIIETFNETPFRLACTATPAPNDYMELGNHAEFIGVMRRMEMLSMFFVHDGGETQKWRLKGHAQSEFWKWLCSWAVMLRKPSDLHYEDGDFILPEIEYIHHKVKSEPTSGALFPMEAQTLSERIAARRESSEARAERIAEIINGDADQWIVWCGLNKESNSIHKLIPGSVEVKGSDSIEHKERSLMGFASGEIGVLVTKPSIAGFGMNFQSCHNMAFLGLSDSWESWYQAVRRCWRFGQTEKVNVHVVTAETEGAVVANIQRKEADAERMAAEMLEHMQVMNEAAVKKGTRRMVSEYKIDKASGKNWTVYLGDCAEIAKDIESESIDYTVFSPPFSSLYTYSNSDRDMGNSRNHSEFFQHFGYLIKEMYRATKPGRLVSIHCMDLPTSKTHHGYIGLYDFRGDVIRAMEKRGFIFHSTVAIWKDPVTAMQRTKAIGLLYKQLRKDSTMSRQGVPDYVVTFRKPGDNPDRVTKTHEGFPLDIWQQWASPVWTDINPSDTLQFRSAREHKDERHIAPLQLEVIKRCILLWSNPGDIVFSPFAGIGSEGYVALQHGRKFIGIELKESYWKQAKANLSTARQDMGELFEAAK